MRCYKGLWYCQGKVYPTLRAALLAAWTERRGRYAVLRDSEQNT